jgi:glycosyltransferase involved in cell wall biosynthesis
MILRLGEWSALHVANATISVSETLAEAYRTGGARRVEFIPNGISINEGDDPSILGELGVEAGKYILFAGRLVPEKGCHYLIDALQGVQGALPLIVAGDSSNSDDYVARLRDQAGSETVFSGYVYGDKLAALFRHCALFVLPSDLEGLPIVLLEALAYGAPVLASDIPPNIEVLGKNGAYFGAGSVSSLEEALSNCLENLETMQAAAAQLRENVIRTYDWDRVADATEALYMRVLDSGAY